MLNRDELRSLSQTSAWRSSLSLLTDWLGIVALFALLIYFPHPITYVLCFILMGRQQLALAIMMHDGAHGRLYKSPLYNNYLGQLFTAAPVFFSQDSYRKFHLKHHLKPLAPEDPDISLIGGYPISGKSFIRKLLRDLLGVSYFKFIGYFFYKARKKKAILSSSGLIGGSTDSPIESGNDKGAKKDKISKNMPIWYLVFSILLINSMMFGILWYLGHPWLYLFFWILPMMSSLQILLRIRGVAEHAGYQANENQMFCSRTVLNPLQTFFFAPHQVNYHMEHHEYPSVPYFNLPKVHQIMKERKSLPETNIYSGYGQILKDLLIS